MKLISILTVLALAGCNQHTLAERVCSLTQEDPAGWVRQTELAQAKDPQIRLESYQRKIADDDCMVNNVYDLAASGLSQVQVVQAAKTQCHKLHQDYLTYGYVQHLKDGKALNPQWVEAQPDWERNANSDTDELAQRAYVEARAGECWKHRTYLPKG